MSPSPFARAQQVSGRLPDFVVIGTQKGGHHGVGSVSAGPSPDRHADSEGDRFLHRFSGRARRAERTGLLASRRRLVPPAIPRRQADLRGGITELLARAQCRPGRPPDRHRPFCGSVGLSGEESLERIRSHDRMAIRKPGAVAGSVPDFVANSDTLSTSAYGTILQTFLRGFPRDRILVLESADLDHRRRESLASVFRFLGVDDRFWSAGFDRRVFVGSSRPHVSPLGTRVRDSAAMAQLRRRLSNSAFYHVERVLLAPLRIPDPPLTLPPTQATAIVASMTAEMNLLRDLTGLQLPSLEVSMEQATSPADAPRSSRRFFGHRRCHWVGVGRPSALAGLLVGRPTAIIDKPSPAPAMDRPRCRRVFHDR